MSPGRKGAASSALPRPAPARKTGVVIESLDSHRNPNFNGMMRLFKKVFPPRERIDRSYFEQILAEKRMGLLDPFNTHVLVGLHGKKVVEFATGTYLAVVNMGFVGYLAVDPALKGLRLGSRLRERLVKDMRRDARAAGHADLAGVLGEIERPNPWLRHLVRERKALALDIDYRQPSLRADTPPVQLVLYVEPIQKPIKRMSAARVRAILYAVYRRLYRLRFPLKESSFRKMLKSIGTRRTIGPMKLNPEKPSARKPASPRGDGGRAAGKRS